MVMRDILCVTLFRNNVPQSIATPLPAVTISRRGLADSPGCTGGYRFAQHGLQNVIHDLNRTQIQEKRKLGVNAKLSEIYDLIEVTYPQEEQQAPDVHPHRP